MELPYYTSLVLFITSLPILAVVAYLGNETDRLSLLAFKDGITNGPSSFLRSWNSTPHCTWQGVICSRQSQRVIILDLQGLSLAGTISPHIGNLSLLRELRLGNNRFVGAIPQEIGRLPGLSHFDVQNNSMSGGIPVNLSYCSQLSLIDLSMNQLVGSIPPELGSLSKLSALFFPGNNLSGNIPPSLGNLSSLSTLSVMDNNLEGRMPNDLGRLTSLSFLQVGSNSLVGPIPPCLYNLSTIYYFAAADNRLTGSLPPNLGLALHKLEGLFLGVNHISGSIPISLTNASRLSEVDLSSNNLRGSVPQNLGVLGGLVLLNLGPNQLGGVEENELNFLPTLTNCSSLQTLSLQDNQLKGRLPSSISNLSTQLDSLVLRGNMISGRIPTGIGNLVNLTLLSMGINLFVGTIPSTVGNLRQLQVLSFRENMLSGEIPASIGNLSSLAQLLLQGNNLEGVIPWNLGECKGLVSLVLSRNNLEGEIPPQLLGLPSLSLLLDLSHNSLSGSLPMEVGNLQSLGELVVSHNRLTGVIPSTLGGCISLERLYMNDNCFEGAIPSALSYMKGIQELDLSHNNLSGQVPAYFGSFQYLWYLNLSYNDLGGQVPKDGIFTNASAVSLLGNSHLCGGIPTFKLPTCPTQAPNGRAKARHVKQAVLVICLVLFSAVTVLILYVLLMSKKSRRKPTVVSSIEDQYRRVSYSDLFRATEGFSSSKLVGVGSYGAVYMGKLAHDQAIVAVKVLNLRERDASKSFLTECKVLRSLRHRNLIKIITLCSAVDSQGNDFKALVLEFMSNGSLDEWLHSKEQEYGQHPPKCLNLLQRLDIAIDVAFALHYLHHYGPTPTVHCDLKPGNILLDDDMTAHVGDFGLARFLSKTVSTDTFVGEQISSVGIKGTIGYIPPEYGMGGEASTEGDIYSYGILLLEMLTGKRPTDAIFTGNQNLCKFVELAFPQRVMNVIDPPLLVPEGSSSNARAIGYAESERNEVGKLVEDCLIDAVRIGLSCCAELPQERPLIGDIVVELQRVRKAIAKKLKGGGIDQEMLHSKDLRRTIGDQGQAPMEEC